MDNENPKKCERCDSSKPARTYDPRTPGHPHKRVKLCDKCAAKDPKAVLAEDENPKVNVNEVQPESAKESENQPNEIETIEFGPKTQPIGEMIASASDGDAITIPAGEYDERTKPQNPTKDVETKAVDRTEIRTKLEKQEKDLDILFEKRREILKQLDQITGLIAVKKGAIAGYRDLLGNE